MTHPSPRYFPALTGLRAWLAWDVFLFHYGDSGRPLLRQFMAGGGEVGVSLFFLLSGFLIAHQYGGEVRPGRRYLPAYFFRRWSRIYPLFAAVSVLSLALLWAHGDRGGFDAAHLILHFTLLKGFFQQHLFSFIGPAWSLTVEECFYALAPLMLLLLRRKIGLLWQCLLLALLGLLIVRLSQAAGSTDFVHEYNFLFYWTFFGRAFQFCCGIALAVRLRRRPPRAAGRFPFRTLAGIAALLGAQCCFLSLHQIPLGTSPDALAIGFNNVVVPLLGTLLLYGLIAERSLFSGLLGGRLFALLGRSSYAFYLIHLSPLLLLPMRQFHWPPLLSFAVAQATAILFYSLLEQPLHRRLNRWWKQRSRNEAAQVPL